MDYGDIVQGVIEELRVSPVDMLGIGDAAGEYTYVNSQKAAYARTVRDVANLYHTDRATRRVLEIGAFLGTVSVSLKRVGYSVSASDMPAFYQSPSLRALYERNGIDFSGVNLQDGELPYAPDSFDVVVACEVLEHLNFNPLPVIGELNRVTKPGGYLYIAMPNQSSAGNRARLALGKSVNQPIGDFCKQLDRNQNMLVGLHWREYTLTETIQMLGVMGFETVDSYYFSEPAYPRTGVARSALRRLLYLYPPFRPSQVVIGRKTSAPA